MNEIATMKAVEIPVGTITLQADLRVPAGARGLVMFAHGSGSSRFSARNRQVAEYLGDHRFATLLLDLLTPQEDAIDVRTTEYRFDIARLGPRVSAAAERPATIAAVVSRGGRPDLAGEALARVEAPTLLMVGGRDEPVIEMIATPCARCTRTSSSRSCRQPRICSRNRTRSRRWPAWPPAGSRATWVARPQVRSPDRHI